MVHIHIYCFLKVTFNYNGIMTDIKWKTVLLKARHFVLSHCVNIFLLIGSSFILNQQRIVHITWCYEMVLKWLQKVLLVFFIFICKYEIILRMCESIIHLFSNNTILNVVACKVSQATLDAGKIDCFLNSTIFSTRERRCMLSWSSIYNGKKGVRL